MINFAAVEDRCIARGLLVWVQNSEKFQWHIMLKSRYAPGPSQCFISKTNTPTWVCYNIPSYVSPANPAFQLELVYA